ncbi:MAG: methyl-accepting chemotaxis protein [Holophagaceae bacterium]|nr:methyl-accepting chemotaxis protein [Holophagaceae bacterium]
MLRFWSKLALQVKVICLFTFANLVIISFYTAFTIRSETATELKEIDKRLAIAAHTYTRVVGEENIDLALSEKRMSDETYIELVASMGKFAEDIGMEYLYSMTVEDSTVKYVIDGSTQSDIDKGEFCFPLEEYEDADEKLFEAWKTWKPAIAEYNDTFGYHRSYFMPMTTSAGNKIIIGVDMEMNEVKQIIKNILTTQIFIGLAILASGFLISFPFARIIAKSMIGIAKDIRYVAENQDFTKEIHVQNQDEVGAIADNINMLQNVIKQTIGHAYTMAEGSATQAEHFITAASSIQVKVSSATNMVEHISEQSGNIREQAQLAAQNANSIQRDIEGINQQLSDARIALKELADGVNSTAHNNRTLANELQTLTNKVGAVKIVLDTVTEISDQTNLLSINASIEAAHAGKLGAGFAVVADEVRSLANKTQQTVRESEEVIRMITSSVDEIISKMVGIVETNEKLTRTSSTSLSNIESIHNRLSNITSNSAESASNSDAIRTSILSVSDSIKEINDTMSTSKSQVEEILDSAVSIRDDAKEIVDYLSGYKIK